MLGPPPLPRTLEASLRDLDSHRPEVRVSAIEDLVRHARRSDSVRADALAKLERKLDDSHPAVRAAVAVALGDLAASESLPKLLLAMDDDDAHVREMAITALGAIRDGRAAPRLRRALSDARPEVRYQAIIALSRVADDADEIDEAIIRATRDEDEAIAHIALRIAEERIDDGRSASAELCARARALLESPSPHVALVAAIVLAKSGDAVGHDLVLRVVRGERIRGEAPGKEDEQAAVELAGEVGLRAAVPHLERRVWGLARFVRDTCAFHARIALARMGHDRAKKEILADLSSGKREAAAAAVVAAGRAHLVEAKDVLERLPAGIVDGDLVREALARLEKTP